MKPISTHSFLAGLTVLLAFAPLANAAQLPIHIDLAQPPGSEGARFTRAYPGAGDAMGAGNQTIAVADFNGDGHDDYAVGFAGYTPPEAMDSLYGRVFIIFGGAETPAERDLATFPSKLTINCTDAFAQFGYSVAAGDVTDDGLPDLVVGAYGARSGRGVVVVLENAVVSTPGSLDINTDQMNPTSGETRYVGTEDGAGFGYAVACADTNTDGAFEIIIGEPGATVGGNADSGKTHVVFGHNYVSGMTRVITDEPEAWEIQGGAGNRLGSAVAAGDLDGNGISDVFVGAPNLNGASGGVYGFFDVSTGPNTLDVTDSGNFAMMLRLHGYQSLGFALDTGNVNFDGKQDLFIGMPLYSPTLELEQAGAAIIFPGRDTLVGESLDLSQSILASGSLRIEGPAPFARAGGSVALGDVDGDGRDDLCVGIPFAKGNGDAEGNFGRIAVVSGTHVHFSGFSLYQLHVINGDVNLYGGGAMDFLGAALNARGDLNRDGYADLVMTAGFASNPAQDGTGLVHTLYGDGTATSATQTTSFLSGDSVRTGIGGPLSPVLRTEIAFVGGSDGTVTSVLTRSKAAITNLGNPGRSNVAPVIWDITTTRTAWMSATLSLQYTDAEIAGFNESLIALYRAPALDGPWTEVAGQVIDADANRITFTTDSLSVFAIVTVAPVISLIGGAEREVDCGNPSFDPGATALAFDGTDLTGEIVVSGDEIDIFAVGATFFRHYDVMDAMNNPAATVTRTFRVVDIDTPYIQVDGSNELTVECGAPFSPPEVTAFDDCAGDITVLMTVEGGPVDASAPGSYLFTYNVMDPAGLSAATRFVFVDVEDTLAPNLILSGDENMTVPCGGAPFTDPGATATDQCDGNLTGAIMVAGDLPVNVNEPDGYNIHYTVADGGGRTTQKTRTVNVVDVLDPVLTLVGDENITHPCGTPFNDPGATATDQCDGNLTGAIMVTGDPPVNVNEPGPYNIHYAVTDGAGRTVQKTRVVEVVGNCGSLALFEDCPASSVYGQAPSDVNGAGEISLSHDGTDIAYEKFTGVNAPISMVRWWGYGTIPGGESCVSAVNAFFISFYEDNLGELGTMVASQNVIAEAVETGLVVDGNHVLRLQAALPVPVALANGWIRIFGFGGNCEFNWYRSPQGDGTHRRGAGVGGITSPRQGNLAFCLLQQPHSADVNANNLLDFDELLRLIQFFNAGFFGCQPGTEDGFAPRDPDQNCAAHAADYNPQNWIISFSELLRAIQFYNSAGVYRCTGQSTEDGYCLAQP